MTIQGSVFNRREFQLDFLIPGLNMNFEYIKNKAKFYILKSISFTEKHLIVYYDEQIHKGSKGDEYKLLYYYLLKREGNKFYFSDKGAITGGTLSNDIQRCNLDLTNDFNQAFGFLNIFFVEKESR